MENHTMEKTIQAFDMVLSSAGIPFFKKHKWNSKKWLLLQIFNVFIAFMTFSFCFMFLITNISNLLLCIQGACICFTAFVMTISLFICLIFKKKFQGFIEEMVFKDRTFDLPLVEYAFRSDVNTGKLYELKCLARDSQEKMLKIARILILAYTGSDSLCCTLYITEPIYKMVVTDDDTLRLIAFDMWFPWSLENYSVFVPTFILNSYTGYLCGVSLSTLQSTIVLLISQIVRQLQVIRFILAHLDDLMEEIVGQRDLRWQGACSLVLTQCVDHYVKTKRFSNRLNVICQPFYLTLILIATIIVCVCSVKIAVSRTLNVDTMKYVTHAVCIMFAVLMFSFVGQQVENQCEKLETAVLERWYVYDRKHKINLLFFHTALSQRMPIYIFGSIPLCLPTYTWFINTVMSFFTLVMSVLESE